MNPNNNPPHGVNGKGANASVSNTNTPVAETHHDNHSDTNMPVAANSIGNGNGNVTNILIPANHYGYGYGYAYYTNMNIGNDSGNNNDTNMPIGANHYGNGYAHSTNMYVGENHYYHGNVSDTSMPVNENHYGSGSSSGYAKAANDTNMSVGENHYQNCYGNDYSNAYSPVPQQVDHQFFTRNTGMLNQRFCTNVSNNYMALQPLPPIRLGNASQLQVIPPSGYNIGVPLPMSDEEYFNSMPPSWRFCPHDDELIEFYLKSKLANQCVPRNCIHEVNLYDFHPQDLTRKYNLNGEDSWYFFTSRNRKYPKGDRPDRAAGNGYWKPTATDKPIVYANNRNNVIGHKKSLDYYEGKHPTGKKTDWKMHEYLTAEQLKKSASKYRRDTNSMMLNDWVLCRIYKKKDKKNDNDDEDEAAEDLTATDDGRLKYLINNRNIGNNSASASASAYNGHANHHDHVPPPQHQYQFGSSNYYGSLPMNHHVTADCMASHGGSSSAELISQLITVSTSSATQRKMGQPPVVRSSHLIINGPEDHVHDTSPMTDNNHTSSTLVAAEENNSSELPNNAAVAGLSSSENNLDQENDPVDDLEEWLNTEHT